MRVAAFTRYDRTAASTRQRLLQYLPALNRAGIEVDYHPLLGGDYVRSLVTQGGFSKLAIARSYARRLKQLIQNPDGDLIWIYAELFPYLPAAFERLAFRSGKPVVYDFDDAFFHPYDNSSRSWVRRLLNGKLEPLLSGAAACCCGNRYLQEYAREFCDNSVVLPTVVDTSIYRPAPPESRGGELVIGWIGSPSAWVTVRPLIPLLRQLCAERQVRVSVVGAGVAAEADLFPGLDLVDWSEATEVAEVQKMDIGIMPLMDTPFQRGKSGYKLIQYMACGLPVVAAPVGVNAEIVLHERTGILATSQEEWRVALETLISSAELRRRMGTAGRARAENNYSLASQAPRLVDIFRTAASSR